MRNFGRSCRHAYSSRSIEVGSRPMKTHFFEDIVSVKLRENSRLDRLWNAKMEFDHVLRIIGEFGPHQRRLYVLLNLSLIPAAFQLLLHVFVGAEPIRICSLPNETCNRNSSACAEVEYSSKSFTIIAEVREFNFIFLLFSLRS